jgi:hypothetical protein
MKALLTKLLLTLSIIAFFTACVGEKKNTTIELPKWYLNPPANNFITLYGTGEGKTLNEAKNNALKDMSEKLVVSVASSMNSITTTSDDGTNSSYLKENIKNVKVEAKKITFSNYKTQKAIQNGNSFFVMVSSDRHELFNEQKKEFDLIDRRIDSALKTLVGKSKLEKIHLLQNQQKNLNDGKNKSFVLYAIENDFGYQSYHKKYDDIIGEIDFLKNSVTISINSNLKTDPYKEHIISLLNQNNYKIVTNNSEVVIDINSNVRYSKARGWDIAKVATTINVKAQNKTITNQTINTLGRSSSSKENALVSSGDKFKKEIEKQGVDKVLFGK